MPEAGTGDRLGLYFLGILLSLDFGLISDKMALRNASYVILLSLFQRFNSIVNLKSQN